MVRSCKLVSGPALLAMALLAGCEGGLPKVNFPDVELPKLDFLDELRGGGSSSLSELGVGDELLVTNSLTGESCRVRKLSDGGDIAIEDLVVLCGGWTEPSGRIRRFVSQEPARLEPLLTTAELTLWAPASASCEPVESTATSDGVPMLVRSCIKSDGWPMLAWAGQGTIGDQPATYAGYGLPHLAPVIDAILTGRGVTRVQTGSRSPLSVLAEQQITGPGGRISLDDVMSFRHLLELGLAFNHAGEFAQAVEAYERALDIKRARQGGRDVYTAPVLAALGLNLASDNRRLEAEVAFEEAGKLADRLRGSEAYPTLLAYRAAFETALRQWCRSHVTRPRGHRNPSRLVGSRERRGRGRNVAAIGYRPRSRRFLGRSRPHGPCPGDLRKPG